MSKEENVIKYYMLCNKLKRIIRSGWLVWNVDRKRLESVAEHVFGVQMLALAMFSEYNYDVDINKVIMMLAVHDLGKAVIGDEIAFELSGINKEDREHAAISKIFANLMNGEELESLILEYDARKTPEAKFAFACDKLECDLQSTVYSRKDAVDLDNQNGNKFMNHEIVKSIIDDGNSWGEMWLKFGQTVYNYDENFMNVSKYVLENGYTKKKSK